MSVEHEKIDYIIIGTKNYKTKLNLYDNKFHSISKFVMIRKNILIEFEKNGIW